MNVGPYVVKILGCHQLPKTYFGLYCSMTLDVVYAGRFINTNDV